MQPCLTPTATSKQLVNLPSMMIAYSVFGTSFDIYYFVVHTYMSQNLPWCLLPNSVKCKFKIIEV